MNTNKKLTPAQKRAITIANKKALKALETASTLNESNQALAVLEIETEALEVLTLEQYQSLLSATNVNAASNYQLAVIEREFIESSAQIHDLKELLELRALEVALELESKVTFTSESKKLAMEKNYINRMQANKAFLNASLASLQLIVKRSNESTLEYLLNASNYKTASRVLDAAKMMNNEKHSSILDYTLKAIKRSMMQKTSVDQVCTISNQCYARISNAVKALAFFDLIDVTDCSFDSKTNIINKMSKNTLVSIKA